MSLPHNYLYHLTTIDLVTKSQQEPLYPENLNLLNLLIGITAALGTYIVNEKLRDKHPEYSRNVGQFGSAILAIASGLITSLGSTYFNP